MISAWTRAHLAQLDVEAAAAPVITRADLPVVLPGFDVWDMWPLALRDGATAAVGDGVLWFALAAPIRPDPIERHGLARIRLLWQRGAAWHDAGNALPDGLAPGSREWSGSAILAPDTGEVTLFFTVAGRTGEAPVSYEQRLFQVTGVLESGGDLPRIAWGSPVESVAADDHIYARADQRTGAPGKILAFRDPAYFCDPADGASYLLFAGSLKQSAHEARGAIGVARAADARLGGWALLPPLLHADAVNAELERPHMLVHGGLYYLFWSTQRHTFAAGADSGPTGLYGAAAPRFGGPYTPLNGGGLVIANPASEPLQAYSWWVLGDLRVTSFVDVWGLGGRSTEAQPELARRQFGGVPAPFLKLRLDGWSARLER
jgi:levansucrase